MLGGPDSFADGKYDRTPVGELLPVYLNRPGRGPGDEARDYRLVLTREGWLQPWVRTRKTEDEERKRLAAMPPFQTLSRVGQHQAGGRRPRRGPRRRRRTSPRRSWRSSSARGTSRPS